MVIFFSTFVTMMYYVGFMQFIIRNVGRFLAFCLGTSPAESLNAAGNIFIGQVSSRDRLSARRATYAVCITRRISEVKDWSRVRVEVDVLVSPSLIVLIVSMGVKQH